jgi:hypothetical protein
MARREIELRNLGSDRKVLRTFSKMYLFPGTIHFDFLQNVQLYEVDNKKSFSAVVDQDQLQLENITDRWMSFTQSSVKFDGAISSV